jgi:hypothetical protein
VAVGELGPVSNTKFVCERFAAARESGLETFSSELVPLHVVLFERRRLNGLRLWNVAIEPRRRKEVRRRRLGVDSGVSFECGSLFFLLSSDGILTWLDAEESGMVRHVVKRPQQRQRDKPDVTMRLQRAKFLFRG